MQKKAHRAGNWKKRWFVLSQDDQNKQATLQYWADSTKTELKGQHILSASSQVFGLPAEGSHKFCFKLLAKGSDIVMDAEAANVRMKWILAIESMVMDIRQFEAANAASPTHQASVEQAASTINKSNRHSANIAEAPSSHDPEGAPAKPLMRTGSDLTDYISKRSGSRYEPVITDRHHIEHASSSSNDIYTNNRMAFVRTKSPDSAMPPVAGSSTKSGDFTFRALVRDNPTSTSTSTLEATVVDKVNTQTLPTTEETSLSSDSNNVGSIDNNNNTDISNTKNEDHTGLSHRLSATTEQHLLLLSESLLRAWMADDQAAYEDLVTNDISGTIFASEFMLSAQGKGYVWDLKGNTFFNPLGNYHISGAVAIREAIKYKHDDNDATTSIVDDKKDDRNTTTSKSNNNSVKHSVWCEVFVLPTDSCTPLSQHRLDDGRVLGTGEGYPSGSGVSGVSGGGASSVSLSSSSLIAASAVNNSTSISKSASLSAASSSVPSSASSSLAASSSSTVPSNNTNSNKSSNFPFNTKALEEYEVELVFSLCLRRISRLLFHRVDVSIARLHDETMAAVQRTITEAMLAMHRPRQIIGRGNDDNDGNDGEDGVGEAAGFVTDIDAVFADKGIPTKTMNANRRTQSTNSAERPRSRSKDKKLKQRICHKDVASSWSELVTECALDEATRQLISQMTGLCPNGPQHYYRGTAPALIQTTVAADSEASLLLPSQQCVHVLGKEEFDQTIINLLSWTQQPPFQEIFTTATHINYSNTTTNRAADTGTWSCAPSSDISLDFPEYISIPDPLFQVYYDCRTNNILPCSQPSNNQKNNVLLEGNKEALEELVASYRVDDLVTLNIQFPTFSEGFKSVGINIDFPIHKTVSNTN